jgi:hypothetical protein
MKMVLLRIGERQPGSGYPLELFVEDEDDSWQSTACAAATLPDDLDAGELDDWSVGGRDDVVNALRESVLGPDRGGTSQRVGEHLYRLLARGDVKHRWDELAAEDVRFALQVVDADLRQLPWELVRRNAGYVFADETRPWFRIDAAAQIDPAPAEVPWSIRCPLRILILVGSEETDRELRAEQEVREIVSAIAASDLPIEWHVERRPTHGRLKEVLRWTQPHVLHFIGHSSSEMRADGTQGEDALVVSTPGAPWEYTTALIAADLGVARPVLVVLNACRLAASETSRRQAEGVWTVAGVYRDRDVPAILAMQGDIRGEDAQNFTKVLYDALLKRDLDIDAAVASARVAIEAAGLRLRDFGFPSLTLKCRPETMLPMPRPRLKTAVRDYIVETFGAEPFVDRCEERSRLASELLPTPAPAESVLVSVVGAEEVGKSWLVRWCLYVKALLGHNVAYVDVAEQKEDRLRTPLEVLRDIRRALTACPRHGAANEEHLGSLDLDDGAFDRVLSDDPVEEVIGPFRAALAAAAKASGGVVLALDHIHEASEDFKPTVGEHLLRPVADGDVPGVRLVVVRSDSDESAKRVPFAVRVEPTIDVGPIPAQECEPLARTFLYHLGWTDAEGLARSVKTEDPNDWPMSRFGGLKQTVKLMGRR